MSDYARAAMQGLLSDASRFTGSYLNAMDRGRMIGHLAMLSFDIAQGMIAEEERRREKEEPA